MASVTELRGALTVRGFGEALAFYRGTLGLEQVADGSSETGRVVVLDAGRATLELLDDAQAGTVDAIEAGRRVSGTVRLALEVANSEDMARRLVAAGAAQVAPAVVTPWGDRNARVRAPDGMQLTLFTPEEASGQRGGGCLRWQAAPADRGRGRCVLPMSSRREHRLHRHQTMTEYARRPHDGHRLVRRRAGRRALRRGQRAQPLLRDARRRAAADLAARRARVGRDVRPGPSRADGTAPGHRSGLAGTRPDRRHRPAARRAADGRRHRRAHRPPRAGPAGPGGLLAGRR